MAEQILTNIISTIGVRCRNYAHYTSYKSCIFNIWVAIAGSLSPGRYRRVAIAGSLSPGRYQFYFLMILKESLNFLLLSPPVPQSFVSELA